MKLTKRQSEVLEDLKAYGGWARPMDIGGSAVSDHSRILNQLVYKGLVEKQPRGTLLNHLWPDRKGASMVYTVSLTNHCSGARKE